MRTQIKARKITLAVLIAIMFICVAGLLFAWATPASTAYAETGHTVVNSPADITPWNVSGTGRAKFRNFNNEYKWVDAPATVLNDWFPVELDGTTLVRNNIRKYERYDIWRDEWRSSPNTVGKGYWVTVWAGTVDTAPSKGAWGSDNNDWGLVPQFINNVTVDTSSLTVPFVGNNKAIRTVTVDVSGIVNRYGYPCTDKFTLNDLKANNFRVNGTRKNTTEQSGINVESIEVVDNDTIKFNIGFNYNAVNLDLTKPLYIESNAEQDDFRIEVPLTNISVLTPHINFDLDGGTAPAGYTYEERDIELGAQYDFGVPTKMWTDPDTQQQYPYTFVGWKVSVNSETIQTKGTWSYYVSTTLKALWKEPSESSNVEYRQYNDYNNYYIEYGTGGSNYFRVSIYKQSDFAGEYIGLRGGDILDSGATYSSKFSSLDKLLDVINARRYEVTTGTYKPTVIHFFGTETSFPDSVAGVNLYGDVTISGVMNGTYNRSLFLIQEDAKLTLRGLQNQTGSSSHLKATTSGTGALVEFVGAGSLIISPGSGKNGTIGSQGPSIINNAGGSITLTGGATLAFTNPNTPSIINNGELNITNSNLSFTDTTGAHVQTSTPVLFGGTSWAKQTSPLKIDFTAETKVDQPVVKFTSQSSGLNVATLSEKFALYGTEDYFLKANATAKTSDYSLIVPVITQDITVDEVKRTYDGTETTLSISATYKDLTDGLTYQWYRIDPNTLKEVKIPNATASSYTVKNVADSGTIYCRILYAERSVDSKIVTVTISPIELNVTWGSAAFTYDGNAKTPSVSIADGSLSKVLEADKAGLSVSATTENPAVNASNSAYTATAVLSNGNYSVSASTQTKTFVINKATPTVNPKVDTTTYFVGGDKPTLSLTTGDTAGTITWTQGQDWTTAGTREFTWSFVPTDQTNYNTANGTISLTVKAVELESISATLEQGNIKVYTNTSIDDLKTLLSSVLTVTGTNNDGSAYNNGAAITDYTLTFPSGVTAFTTGNNTVVVGYGGKNTNITVNVTEKSFVSIEIATQPTNKNYSAFDTFDTWGMVVKAHYSDGTSKAVTGYTVKYAGNNTTLIYGDTSVTISYTENGVEKTATVSGISVNKIKLTAPTVSGTYTYSGSEQTVTLSGYDGNTMTVSNNKRTNVGEQNVTVALKDTTNYEWSNGTTAPLSLKWTIATLKVTAPTADTTQFTYTGQEQTYAVASSEYYTVTGNTRTNAGKQTVTVALKDKSNTEWTGGGVADITFDYTISTAKIAKPAENTTTFTYNGSAQTYQLTENSAYSITGNVKTDAGEYTVTVALNNPQGVINYEWTTGGSDALTFNFVIGKKAVAKPAITGTYEYSGSEQTANVATTAEYTVTGNKQTDAGTYTVTITPKANYKWSDGTETALMLEWKIARKKLTITPSYDTNAKVFVGGSLPAITATETTAGAIAWNTPIDLSVPATNKAFGWTWMPTDTKNYEVVTGTVNFDVLAVTLESITATFNQGQNTIYATDSLDSLKQYLTVTGTNNDGTSASTITNYTLAGDLTTGGTVTITVNVGQIQDTFTVNVTEVALDRITVSFNQGNIKVFTSTSIDNLKNLLGNALVVTKHFNNGVKQTTTTFTLSGDLTQAGTAEITVTADGKNAKFNVTVTEVALASITATFDQGQNAIYTSATLDSLKTYLTVSGTNNDGSAYSGTIEYTLSGKLTAGTSTITVTVNGKQIADTFDVTVTAVALESIAANFQQGENKVYPVTSPDTLKQWLTVTGTNNDGTSAGEITDYELSGTLAVGTAEITVTAKGTSVTTTFTVTVTATALESIAVTTQPTKTEYTAFEDFDAAGMVVTATFSHGTEVITDYTVASSTNLQAGTTALTISYIYDGDTKTTTVAITVAKIQLDKPIISGSYTYTGEEQTAEIAGITDKMTVTNGKRTNAGTQNISVALNDKTNYEWKDGTNADLTLEWTIGTLKVAAPIADTNNFTYTGEEQNYEVAPSENYIVSGDKRTNAGEQTVTVALKDKTNTEWADGGTDDITFAFKIAKASYDMSGVTFADSTVKEDGKAHRIEVSGLPEGVSVATYAGTNSYTDDGARAVGVYEVTATFTVTDADNYHVPEAMTATLTINVPEITGGGVTDDGNAEIIIGGDDGVKPGTSVVVEEKPVEEYKEANIVIADEKHAVMQVTDIKLEREGTAVQPDGTVTVKMLIKEDLRGYDNLKVLYIAPDGSTQDMNATRDGDYMVFDTTHFSVYAIVVPQSLLPTLEQPGLGGGAIFGIVFAVIIVLLILALLALFFFRKDKAVGFKEYYVALGGTCATTVKGWGGKVKGLFVKDNAKDDTIDEQSETPEEIAETVTEQVAEEAVDTPITESDDDEIAAAAVESIEVSEDEIEEEVEDEAEITIDDEPEELNAEIVSEGKTVRVTYRRTFLAKLIQSSDDNKRYYSAIKNEFKSFGVTSSVAVNGNNFSYKRKPLGRVVFGGDTLKLYLALNPAEVESKYNAHDASAVKKYEKTPCFVRVKSDMGLKKALVLIGRTMKSEGIERNPRYVWTDIASIYPNEPLETLIAKDLIKVIERQPVDGDKKD